MRSSSYSPWRWNGLCDAPPGEEIAGFTADLLFSDERRQRALQIVPVAAAFTPAPFAPAEEKGFAGEGGRFGGGGATEKF